MARPTPPPGEAHVMCAECVKGCTGHLERCRALECECPRRRTKAHDRLESRWTALRNRGQLSEDATLLACALRTAAEQFDRDAAEFTDDSMARTRAQFADQALQCRIIAEAIAL